MSDSIPRAARARELVTARGFGILATLSARRSGFPFGSTVTYAADDRGRPVLLLSGLAVHAKNLAADSKASLVVFDENGEHNPLGSPRLNLLGEVRLVPDDEIEIARGIYLERHPKSADYLEFADFSFYRMEIFDIYYIAGFGDMGWASVSEYASI